jgi:hypothetical protein
MADWASRVAGIEAAKAAETAKARDLIDEFVAALREAGVAPEPLLATGYSGGKYRTGITGWYLNAAKSLGVDERGAYYILSTPGGPLERLKGCKLLPTDPPLWVGKGGRDGESTDLPRLLAKRLAELTG